MKLTPGQLANLQAALAGGVSAISFILQPAIWPLFAEWATERSGETWNESDREAFNTDMAILALIGGLRHDPGNARQH